MPSDRPRNESPCARPEARAPLVAIVVLNFNAEQWLDACLRSVAETQYAPFHVIVVDNASCDGSVEYVRSRFPDVELVENGSNLGFCEGNNVGIRRALELGADYVVLLNPDTKVDPGWLAELVRVGESAAEVGILGPTQLDYDRDDLARWTLQFAVAHIEALRDPTGAPDWIPVRWVEGSCFAVKRHVVERIGLLDPIYGSFFEELDYCRRAMHGGYKTALVPRARFRHKGGAVWTSTARLRRERELRYDRSHLIYSATDPGRSIVGNAIRYVLTSGRKVVQQVGRGRPGRVLDVLRLQPAMVRNARALLAKWQRDRAVRATPTAERCTDH